MTQSVGCLVSLRTPFWWKIISPKITYICYNYCIEFTYIIYRPIKICCTSSEVDVKLSSLKRSYFSSDSEFWHVRIVTTSSPLNSKPYLRFERLIETTSGDCFFDPSTSTSLCIYLELSTKWNWIKYWWKYLICFNDLDILNIISQPRSCDKFSRSQGRSLICVYLAIWNQTGKMSSWWSLIGVVRFFICLKIFGENTTKLAITVWNCSLLYDASLDDFVVHKNCSSVNFIEKTEPNVRTQAIENNLFLFEFPGSKKNHDRSQILYCDGLEWVAALPPVSTSPLWLNCCL